ncbi:MAG: TonB family protein [Alphaproteobacteria bacterium]|uniref:TonB family protein n=1 Tax=Candidatus Nitrobium versatile TaxID=2884831 RepID=A0A953JED2_9BACT|nr:TonB family protein [Candidatus Nitrobium versatile]
MNRHGKALQFSLALHTLIFAAFAGIGGTLSALTAKNRLMPMEFDLEIVETAAARPAARTRTLKAAAPAADAAQKAERTPSAPSPREEAPRAAQPVAASLTRDVPVKEAPALRSGGEAAIPGSVSGSASPQPAAASSAGGAADHPVRTASLNTAAREGGRSGAKVDTSGIAEGIRGRIEALKSYPFAARRRGVEGTVIVSVKVNGTGDLIENRIQRSSGSPVLDESALSLIKKVFPYKHSAGVDIELDIPITYRLRS